jgi:hypothetical protein
MHCGKRRHLRTLAIERFDQVRKLELCRPCRQAAEEFFQRAVLRRRAAA